jgi:indolepyruvate ferredoxin oxidoreductase alpha subunit
LEKGHSKIQLSPVRGPAIPNESAICLGLGVEPEHVRVVVPLPKNMEEITRTIREEIEYKGVSVIIPRRECIQTLNRKLRQKKADKA